MTEISAAFEDGRNHQKYHELIVLNKKQNYAPIFLDFVLLLLESHEELVALHLLVGSEEIVVDFTQLLT
jgi:hypothetical protein